MIHIGRFGEPVSIDGETMPPMTRLQHNLVVDLLAATPGRLNSADLAKRGGGWREAMARLRASHPAWTRILLMPGKPYRGHGIAAGKAPGCAPTEVHRS